MDLRSPGAAGVGRVAVPMDKVEPRARWTGGGGGPDLSRVNNMGRKAMNDEALQAFRGHWDVLRCARGRARWRSSWRSSWSPRGTRVASRRYTEGRRVQSRGCRGFG